MSPARFSRFHHVAQLRCLHRLSVVCEGLSKPFNVSAIQRTCENFGVHNLHTIDTKAPSHRAGQCVSKGAARWLSVTHHDSVATFAKTATRSRSVLLVSDLGGGARPLLDVLRDIPEESPIAVAFGGELDGISEELRAEADVSFFLPGLGLTTSFNVNASVAATLQALLMMGRITPDATEQEQHDLMVQWMKHSVPRLVREVERRSQSE